MERDLITYPTWEKYTILSLAITNLSIRDRRVLFQLMRKEAKPIGDLFFPTFGFTLAEFAVWYTLTDARRKVRKSSRKRSPRRSAKKQGAKTKEEEACDDRPT